MSKLSQYARDRVVTLHSAGINLKYIAWWLMKETNYNNPWHFKKNAKQMNVYIQIIELTVDFDNVCFVTNTVVIYFD